jgi:hypothetical protein
MSAPNTFVLAVSLGVIAYHGLVGDYLWRSIFGQMLRGVGPHWELAGSSEADDGAAPRAIVATLTPND